ncbi:MAG: hypothetical protein RL462_642 [Pseudomonadota bacterium]|jgi:hypothetical protein
MTLPVKQVQQFAARQLCLLAFVFALAVPFAFASFASVALADQAVYKCGQEITNQPLDPKLCQQLHISQPTQIEGTRVQTKAQKELATRTSGPSETSENARTQAAALQAGASFDSPDRKAQARTILEDEWQKMSAQYAELVHLYNRGQPTPLAGETTHQANYQQRAMALKVQLQRVERDLHALQRELSRYGIHMTSPLSTLKSK